MNMLGIHAEALSSAMPAYHEFILRFKKAAKRIHGFVEGQEDPSFYQGIIESIIPNEWEVDLRAVGNRKMVIELFNVFDWDRFSKFRILFFIDRDLSHFLGEKMVRKFNLYVTDKYSIENDIVSESTCRRVLKELCNLHQISYDEMRSITDLFSNQLKQFQEHMVKIMCYIILWKRSGRKPSLDNIKMKDMFAFLAGHLNMISKPKNKETVFEYIHSQCNIDFDKSIQISDIETEFRAADGVNRFVRGKYEFWFLIHFALSIYKDIGQFSEIVTAPPKMHTNLSESSGILLTLQRHLHLSGQFVSVRAI